MNAPPVLPVPLPSGAAADDDLAHSVQVISSLEQIVAGWDETQQLTVRALKGAIEDLHKSALQRLIRALKDDPAAGARLRAALSDPVIYAVLRFHELIKASLGERVEQALAEVRPLLETHGGGVELVAILPPDTVELRLTGACHGCPASGQTLAEGVEKALRAHCPEIVHIRQVSRAAAAAADAVHFVSPFAAPGQSGWTTAITLAEIPEAGIVERTLVGRSLLFARRGEQVSCFDNRCAHLGMPLDSSAVSAGVITCSYHGFQYSLATGECLTAPEVQLRVYPVRLIGGRVDVQLGR